jgi:hypothetical protein
MITTHPRFLMALVCALLWPLPMRAQLPPNFTARWDSATGATVQFTLVARGCLYRESAIGERVFVSCYERWPATIIVTFGHTGPLSGDLRPRAGDVYRLDTLGQTYRARLIGRPQYLAVWRR